MVEVRVESAAVPVKRIEESGSLFVFNLQTGSLLDEKKKMEDWKAWTLG